MTIMQVRIVFCRPCNYTDRATEMAKEILTWFGLNDVSVILEPGKNGIYDVYIDQDLVFSRFKEKRFPENKEILEKIASKLNISGPT